MADKPKALLYWVRVNLRKLVEKGAPGLHKGFFLSPIQKQYVSEPSLGKSFALTAHHHGIEKKFRRSLVVFRQILKGILKE